MLAKRPPRDREQYSEFGAANKYGMAMRNILDIGGPRLMPPEVDLDSLKFSVDPTQGGYGAGEFIQFSTNTINLVGVAAGTRELVGQGFSWTFGVTPPNMLNYRPRLDDTQFNFKGSAIPWSTRFHNMQVAVIFDAAGAAALAGVGIDFELLMGPIKNFFGAGAGTAVSIGYYRSLWVVVAGLLTYRYSINGGCYPAASSPQGQPSSLWTRWVPPGWALFARVATTTGVNFPANTTVEYTGNGNQVPEGAQLPL